MSGVLISVAFYAILRVKIIADAALGPDFARALLIVLSLASIAVAASLLLAQRDYKRMLAYSSIENMGLLALGAAIGSPLAVAAVLLHILGHGLAKSVLFLSAGRILQLTGTSRIDAGPRPGRPGTGAGRVPRDSGSWRSSRSRRSACSPASWASPRAGFAARAGLGHRGRADPGAGHRGGLVGPHQPDAARCPTGRHRPRPPPLPRTSQPHRPAPGSARTAAGGRVAVAAHTAPPDHPANGPRRPGADSWALIAALVACAVLGI